MFSLTSRKQVVSLTSAILMVAFITNIAEWIQDVEADPSITRKSYVTRVCVDSDHGGQSDICKSYEYTEWRYWWPWTGHNTEYPHGNHGRLYSERYVYSSTHVTSCSQCPW